MKLQTQKIRNQKKIKIANTCQEKKTLLNFILSQQIVSLSSTAEPACCLPVIRPHFHCVPIGEKLIVDVHAHLRTLGRQFVFITIS